MKIKKIAAMALGIFAMSQCAFGYTDYKGSDKNAGKFRLCVAMYQTLSLKQNQFMNQYGQGLSQKDTDKINMIAQKDALKGVSDPSKVDHIGKSAILSELQYMLNNRPFVHNSPEVNEACIDRLMEISIDPYNVKEYNNKK